MIAKKGSKMDLIEIFGSSKAIMDFDTDEKSLLDNKSFMMAWGIARKKALENMQMVNALLLLKKKYKINEFEFELLLENVDADNLFGA
jgi:hypothetical protein